MIFSDIKVSRFENYMTPDNPSEVYLQDWLFSDEFKEEVQLIRSTEDKARRNQLKSFLPAVTPSGTFSRRATNCLLKHSGFTQFDIDAQDNLHITNFPDLKKQLAKLPEVIYCGLSVSGNGFWGLVRIACPKHHQEHFKALREDFFKWGIVIDDKPGNVASLRGYSYDEDPYFNPSAKLYRRVWTNTKDSNPINQPMMMNERGDDEKVKTCVEMIEKSRIDITVDYSDWFAIGCAFANTYGEAGRSLYHRVSYFHSEYSALNTDRQYNACLRRNYSYHLGTFFAICKDYGITFISSSLN